MFSLRINESAKRILILFVLRILEVFRSNETFFSHENSQISTILSEIFVFEFLRKSQDISSLNAQVIALFRKIDAHK